MKIQRWKNMNTKKKYIVMGIIVFLCVAIIAGVQIRRNFSMENKNPARHQFQTTVDVMAVPRTGLMKRISLTGQTVPEAQVDIAAQYAGKIVAVNSKLGQQVSAGDILIVQDTGDADISILENKAAYNQAVADSATTDATFYANYEKAQATYKLALTDYQRYKTLYEQKAISREALDANEQTMLSAKSALDTLANQMNSSSVPSAILSAQAAAAKAQHTISAVEKQRDDLVLRAPRSGEIGYRQAEVGDFRR